MNSTVAKPTSPVLASTSHVVFVHVTTNLKRKELRIDDRTLPGIYAVELMVDTPPSGLANAAIDGFHDNYGIEVLDDFEITVRKSSDPQSDEIEQSESFDNDELLDKVCGVEPL